MPHQGTLPKRHAKIAVVDPTGGSFVPCRKSICLSVAVPGRVELDIDFGPVAVVELAAAAVFVEPWLARLSRMTALFWFS